MLRQLLTLFAVLAGLTAAVEPARAVEAGVEAVHLAQDAVACQAQVPGLVGVVEDVAAGVENRERICLRPVSTPAVPTVILQADRARE